MTTLPGYDAWKLGGDPHTRTFGWYCPNKMCPEHLEVYKIPVLVEYGMSEAPECVECGAYMEEDT